MEKNSNIVHASFKSFIQVVECEDAQICGNIGKMLAESCPFEFNRWFNKIPVLHGAQVSEYSSRSACLENVLGSPGRSSPSHPQNLVLGCTSWPNNLLKIPGVLTWVLLHFHSSIFHWSCQGSIFKFFASNSYIFHQTSPKFHFHSRNSMYTGDDRIVFFLHSSFLRPLPVILIRSLLRVEDPEDHRNQGKGN